MNVLRYFNNLKHSLNSSSLVHLVYQFSIINMGNLMFMILIKSDLDSTEFLLGDNSSYKLPDLDLFRMEAQSKWLYFLTQQMA